MTQKKFNFTKNMFKKKQEKKCDMRKVTDHDHLTG